MTKVLRHTKFIPSKNMQVTVIEEESIIVCRNYDLVIDLNAPRYEPKNNSTITHKQKKVAIKSPPIGTNAGVKVFVFKDGVKVAEFDSIQQCGTSFNASRYTIRARIQNETIAADGYYFRFHDDPTLPHKANLDFGGRPKPIYSHDAKGNKINDFRSITEACKHFNKSNTAVKTALDNKSEIEPNVYLSFI
jgi:hypothetical protein